MNEKIDRFLNLAINPQAHWQGGVFDLCNVADAVLGDSPIAQANVALWASDETQLVHGKPTIDSEPLDLLISELLEFVETHSFDYRPAHIAVTDEALADQLNEILTGSGTKVTWEAEPEFWSAVKADMAEHILRMGSVEATSLANTKCTLLQIRAFAEAAAAFYRARPWQFLNDADLLQIQTPKPPKYLKYATVLGAGRREFGIGFYELPDTHWDMRAQRLDIHSLEVFGLAFNPIDDVNQDDVSLWKENGLPLETGDAFPQFLFYSHDNRRAAKPKELEYVTIVLAALAETTEKEIDSGQWSKLVSIEGQSKRCKVSIPDLLDPPDRKAWIDRGMMPELRGNERYLGKIKALVQQNEGMKHDQLNALINTQFTGSIDDLDYPSTTSFDRAETLCYAAIDTYGRRRIQLARQALQEDPTHIEANVLLAESIHETSRKIELFAEAVKLGEVKHADLLETEVGHFWGLSETRPLMRAKHGLAASLASDGQANEAIIQMLDILRLNADDNLGVRYEIIPLLLSQNREKEAAEIHNQYSEETGSWLYLKAQIEFRRHGPTGRSAQKAITAALKFNPYVLELLTADHPPMMPEHYALGSPEEAAIVIEEQLESWTESEGFIECLFRRAAAMERESLKRKRERKRKQRKKKRKSRK